jgi:16S rRNA (cytosine1402-N4)-methyltransferase
MDFLHKPVMVCEVLKGLKLKPGGVYVDCTLGGAGHSAAILREIGEEGRLVGLDRDLEALAAAKERLAPFSAGVNLARANFN